MSRANLPSTHHILPHPSPSSAPYFPRGELNAMATHIRKKYTHCTDPTVYKSCVPIRQCAKSLAVDLVAARSMFATLAQRGILTAVGDANNKRYYLAYNEAEAEVRGPEVEPEAEAKAKAKAKMSATETHIRLKGYSRARALPPPPPPPPLSDDCHACRGAHRRHTCGKARRSGGRAGAEGAKRGPPVEPKVGKKRRSGSCPELESPTDAEAQAEAQAEAEAEVEAEAEAEVEQEVEVQAEPLSDTDSRYVMCIVVV